MTGQPPSVAGPGRPFRQQTAWPVHEAGVQGAVLPAAQRADKGFALLQAVIAGDSADPRSTGTPPPCAAMPTTSAASRPPTGPDSSRAAGSRRSTTSPHVVPAPRLTCPRG